MPKTKKQMPKTKKPELSDEIEVSEVATSADVEETSAIGDGSILDYVTGRVISDSEKERVRQRIARALFHEYVISVDDMVPDFKLRIDGRLMT